MYHFQLKYFYKFFFDLDKRENKNNNYYYLLSRPIFQSLTVAGYRHFPSNLNNVRREFNVIYNIIWHQMMWINLRYTHTLVVCLLIPS